MSNDYEPHVNLTAWFSSNLGQLFLQYENQLLNQLLPILCGYYFVQLGPLISYYSLQNNHILKSFTVSLPQNTDNKPHIYCDYEHFPIANASIDAIFLPHIIEFIEKPERLIDEAVNMLIPDGYLIVIGFNPLSLLGLWNGLRRCFKRPSLGKFQTSAVIASALIKSNMEILAINSTFYRPPFKETKWLKRLKFLEALGRLCFPRLGGSYVIIAQKRVVPLSPIRLSWRDQLSNLGKQIVAPTARNYNRDKTY